MSFLSMAALNMVMYVASPCGIDKAYLGMSVVDLEKKYTHHKEVIRGDEEGGSGLLVEIYDDNGRLIFDADIEEGKISSLASDSQLVKTLEGVGPGSSLEGTNKIYGKPYIISSEGSLYAIYKDTKPGYSFNLNKDGTAIESIAVVQNKANKNLCRVP